MNSSNQQQPMYNAPPYIASHRPPYFQGNNNQSYQPPVNQAWPPNVGNHVSNFPNFNGPPTPSNFFTPQNVPQPQTINYNIPPPQVPLPAPSSIPPPVPPSGFPPPVPPFQNTFTSNNPCLQNPPTFSKFHSSVDIPNQFSNFNSSLSNNIKNESASKNVSEDEQWLSKWLKDIGKSQKAEVCKEEGDILKISDTKTLLQQAYSLLCLLSEMKNELNNSLNAEPEVWNKHETICISAQKQLSEITKVLSNEKLLKNVSLKIKNRKKKRIRQKKRKLEINEEKSLKEQKRSYLNKQIDEDMKKMADKITKEKKEKEMKREADSILSEVRKKLSEGSQALRMLNGLEKLRELRKESARRKGLYSSKETDDEFHTMIESLKKLMDKQMSDYHDEEKTLKVIIESEQEVKRAKQKSESQAVIDDQLQVKQNKILMSLFGEKCVPAPGDPLFASWSYFTQADSNLESLVCIRKSWDMFLNNSTHASSIPIEWVIPPVPSSQEWGKYLTENN